MTPPPVLRIKEARICLQFSCAPILRRLKVAISDVTPLIAGDKKFAASLSVCNDYRGLSCQSNDAQNQQPDHAWIFCNIGICSFEANAHHFAATSTGMVFANG
jgi:hypothetical protein